MTPPSINDPVVMYDAIRTYHEWGLWAWETDHRGNVTAGRQPRWWEKAMFLSPVPITFVYIVLLVLKVVP